MLTSDLLAGSAGVDDSCLPWRAPSQQDPNNFPHGDLQTAGAVSAPLVGEQHLTSGWVNQGGQPQVDQRHGPAQQVAPIAQLNGAPVEVRRGCGSLLGASRKLLLRFGQAKCTKNG